MTMLEKAARAVVDTELLSGGCPDKMEAALEVARAVLMAVREPELNAVMEAQDAVDEAHDVSLSVFSVSESFTAMIDAILNEGAA